MASSKYLISGLKIYRHFSSSSVSENAKIHLHIKKREILAYVDDLLISYWDR